jgi:hypothetical protein
MLQLPEWNGRHQGALGLAPAVPVSSVDLVQNPVSLVEAFEQGFLR